MTGQYQTVRRPDSITEGAFPTLEWFAAINRHVDFRDKTVLDLGCAEGSYGVETISQGASWYRGVDTNLDMIQKASDNLVANGFHNADLVNAPVEFFKPGSMELDTEYGVVIFSMIIHWLDDAEKCLKRFAEMAKDEVVIIYRHQHPGGTEEGYRPTVDQLTSLLDLPLKHTEVLLNDGVQYQVLAIYDKNLPSR